MQLEFTKMHVSGNDFIIIEENKYYSTNSFASFNINDVKNIGITALGHRRKGIGFDQLLIINTKELKEGRVMLHIYNSDGSLAETCINGTLCVAHYIEQAYERKEQNISISSGQRTFFCKPLRPEKGSNNASNTSINALIGLELPRPEPLKKLAKEEEQLTKIIKLALAQANLAIIEAKGISEIKEITLAIKAKAFLDLGNPHLILFLTEKAALQALKSLEPLAHFIEQAELLKGGINISLAYIEDAAEDELQQPKIYCRVWERGVGETLSCGSAACCIYFAALQQKLLKPNRQLNRQLNKEQKITLLFPGGETFIDQKANILFAKTNLVFTGKLTL